MQVMLHTKPILTWAVVRGRCLRKVQVRKLSKAAIYRDLLQLRNRGVLQSMHPEEWAPELTRVVSSPQAVYCGFDPTANSLHVGNLLTIIALIHCQRAGHSPIAVVGGATAAIGDPSGKTKDREPIDAEAIEKNVLGISENLKRIFANHEQYIWNNSSKKLQHLRILNNLDWYKNQNVVDFLSVVGRSFRMSQMLAKHSVKSRLQSSEGMCFTEFTYQIFQAHDWLHLLKNYNCRIQIGGNDQLGNITAGHEYLCKKSKVNAFGLTVPLITTDSGVKLGKSDGNALWLSPDKTSPYELYQFFLNLPDTEVEKYMKLFTFLSDDEIENLIRKQKASPESRLAQKAVAEEVVSLVHGTSGLTEAVRWTKALWSEDINSLVSLSATELRRLFKNTPTTELLLEPGTTIMDLVIRAKCFNRTVDAERVIKAGGVYLNYSRVTNPDEVMVPGIHILPINITLMRIGKKNYHIIRWIM
ncbi:hypothetical protein CHS0354_033214 [Potamilus streckersoni]|uniref:Tyrosine--tRNA ligase n=2 Tax=Potamilus streckersoni TaxID=2493646 RepID=A0AAE0VPS6_9BIVA|nr:hypothetical protein CHS0354_033214 [Potamilus streckersoni]